MLTLYSSFFSTFLTSPVSVSLSVPVGPLAFPRYANTSPLVNMPRTPVPLICSVFVILFSRRRRWTEGKSGLECEGGEDECEGGGGGGNEEDFFGTGVGSGVGEADCLNCSFGGSRLDISSPSSARSAITLPTATFFAPSGSYPRRISVICNV